MNESEIIDIIQLKVDILRAEMANEFTRALFPEGREKVVQNLEKRIHDMTFISKGGSDEDRDD